MKIKTKDDAGSHQAPESAKRVTGTETRPRLTVFRSVAHDVRAVVDA